MLFLCMELFGILGPIFLCMRMPPHGFVAVELLIVIATAVTGISAATVAVHPSQEFAARRDAQRTQDVTEIADALSASLPKELVAKRAMMIGTAAAGCDIGCSAVKTASACIDLSDVVLGGVPKDPMGGTDEKTDYYALKNSDGTVTVGACDPEGKSAITATR